MDIRLINKKDEIINVTNLSIKVEREWLIAMNDLGNVIQIEKYEDEGEAKGNLVHIWEMIEMANKANARFDNDTHIKRGKEDGKIHKVANRGICMVMFSWRRNKRADIWAR